MCFTEKEVSIKELKNLLSEKKDFEIWTPDGWQKVGAYVEKGKKKIYSVICQGIETKAAGKHLFETKEGWKFTEDLVDVDVDILCSDGKYHKAAVRDTNNLENVVDIEILHPNHRYFTNNLSSHNTNVGKSAMMTWLSTEYSLQGKKVLYLSMEMAEEKIAQRMDACLFNRTLSQVKNMGKDEFLGNVHNLTKKGMGKIIVKEFPTSTVHMGHVEAYLRELKLKKNFEPDVVMLDYLNICLSKRVSLNKGSYMFVKSIAEEFRGLAVKNNFCGITAVQGDRSTIESSDIGLQNVGESKGINDTVDFMLGLMAPEEIKAQGIMLCKQLKSRYGDVNRKKRFALIFDSEKMKFEDSSDLKIEGFNAPKGDKTKDVPLFDKSTNNRIIEERPDITGDATKALLSGGIKW